MPDISKHRSFSGLEALVAGLGDSALQERADELREMVGHGKVGEGLSPLPVPVRAAAEGRPYEDHALALHLKKAWSELYGADVSLWPKNLRDALATIEAGVGFGNFGQNITSAFQNLRLEDATVVALEAGIAIVGEGLRPLPLGSPQRGSPTQWAQSGLIPESAARAGISFISNPLTLIVPMWGAGIAGRAVTGLTTNAGRVLSLADEAVTGLATVFGLFGESAAFVGSSSVIANIIPPFPPLEKGGEGGFGNDTLTELAASTAFFGGLKAFGAAGIAAQRLLPLTAEGMALAKLTGHVTSIVGLAATEEIQAAAGIGTQHVAERFSVPQSEWNPEGFRYTEESTFYASLWRAAFLHGTVQAVNGVINLNGAKSDYANIRAKAEALKRMFEAGMPPELVAATAGAAGSSKEFKMPFRAEYRSTSSMGIESSPIWPNNIKEFIKAATDRSLSRLLDTFSGTYEGFIKNVALARLEYTAVPKRDTKSFYANVTDVNIKFTRWFESCQMLLEAAEGFLAMNPDVLGAVRDRLNNAPLSYFFNREKRTSRLNKSGKGSGVERANSSLALFLLRTAEKELDEPIAAALRIMKRQKGVGSQNRKKIEKLIGTDDGKEDGSPTFISATGVESLRFARLRDRFERETQENILEAVKFDQAMVDRLTDAIKTPPAGMSRPKTLIEAVQYLKDDGLDLIEKAEDGLSPRFFPTYVTADNVKKTKARYLSVILGSEDGKRFVRWLTTKDIASFERFNVLRVKPAYPPKELLLKYWRLFHLGEPFPRMFECDTKEMTVLATVVVHYRVSDHMEKLRLFIEAAGPRDVARYISKNGISDVPTAAIRLNYLFGVYQKFRAENGEDARPAIGDLLEFERREQRGSGAASASRPPKGTVSSPSSEKEGVAERVGGDLGRELEADPVYSTLTNWTGMFSEVSPGTARSILRTVRRMVEDCSNASEKKIKKAKGRLTGYLLKLGVDAEDVGDAADALLKPPVRKSLLEDRWNLRTNRPVLNELTKGQKSKLRGWRDAFPKDAYDDARRHFRDILDRIELAWMKGETAETAVEKAEGIVGNERARLERERSPTKKDRSVPEVSNRRRPARSAILLRELEPEPEPKPEPEPEPEPEPAPIISAPETPPPPLPGPPPAPEPAPPPQEPLPAPVRSEPVVMKSEMIPPPEAPDKARPVVRPKGKGGQIQLGKQPLTSIQGKAIFIAALKARGDDGRLKYAEEDGYNRFALDHFGGNSDRAWDVAVSILTEREFGPLNWRRKKTTNVRQEAKYRDALSTKAGVGLKYAGEFGGEQFAIDFFNGESDKAVDVASSVLPLEEFKKLGWAYRYKTNAVPRRLFRVLNELGQPGIDLWIYLFKGEAYWEDVTIEVMGEVAWQNCSKDPVTGVVPDSEKIAVKNEWLGLARRGLTDLIKRAAQSLCSFN